MIDTRNMGKSRANGIVPVTVLYPVFFNGRITYTFDYY